MGVLFESMYGCGYNSTHPEPAPLSSVVVVAKVGETGTSIPSRTSYLHPRTRKRQEGQDSEEQLRLPM